MQIDSNMEQENKSLNVPKFYKAMLDNNLNKEERLGYLIQAQNSKIPMSFDYSNDMTGLKDTPIKEGGATFDRQMKNEYVQAGIYNFHKINDNPPGYISSSATRRLEIHKGLEPTYGTIQSFIGTNVEAIGVHDGVRIVSEDKLRDLLPKVTPDHVQRWFDETGRPKKMNRFWNPTSWRTDAIVLKPSYDMVTGMPVWEEQFMGTHIDGRIKGHWGITPMTDVWSRKALGAITETVSAMTLGVYGAIQDQFSFIDYIINEQRKGSVSREMALSLAGQEFQKTVLNTLNRLGNATPWGNTFGAMSKGKLTPELTEARRGFSQDKRENPIYGSHYWINVSKKYRRPMSEYSQAQGAFNIHRLTDDIYKGIAQLGAQATIAAITKSPTAALALGSLHAGASMNEMANDMNMNPGDKFGLFATTVGAVYLTEKLLLQAGFNPIVEKFGKKSMIGDMAKDVFQTTNVNGVTFKTFNKATPAGRTAFLQEYGKNFTKALSKAPQFMKTGFFEGMGEVIQENSEDAITSMYNVMYDKFNQKQILEDQGNPELDQAHRRQFMTDFNTQKNVLENWANEFLDLEKIGVTSIVSFISGFIGGAAISPLHKLSKDPAIRNERVNSILSMLVLAKGDENAVMQALLKEKDNMGYQHIRDGKPIDVNDADQRSDNDLIWETMMQDFEVAKEITQTIGLKNIAINGSIAKDVTMLDQVISLVHEKNITRSEIEELQAEINEEQDETIKKEKETLITEKKIKLEQVNNTIKEYTVPEELYNGKTKYSKQARERVISYQMIRAQQDKFFRENEDTWDEILKKHNVRKGTKKENDLKELYAVAKLNEFFGTNKYEILRSYIDYFSGQRTSEDGKPYMYSLQGIAAQSVQELETINKEVEGLINNFNDVVLPFTTMTNPISSINELISAIDEITTDIGAIDSRIDTLVNQEVDSIDEGKSQRTLPGMGDLNARYLAIENLKTEITDEVYSKLDKNKKALKEMFGEYKSSIRSKTGIDIESGIRPALMDMLAKKYVGQRLIIDRDTKEGQEIVQLIESLLQEGYENIKVENSAFVNGEHRIVRNKNRTDNTVPQDLEVIGIKGTTVTVDELVYLSLLESINHVENSLYEKNIDGTLKTDNNGAYIIDKSSSTSVNIARTLYDRLVGVSSTISNDLANMREALNKVPVDLHKNVNPNEKQRTFNEDTPGNLTKADQERIKSATEALLTKAKTIESELDATEQFFNQQIEIAASRDSIYGLELWGNILTKGSMIDLMNNTLYHPSMPFDFRLILANMQELFKVVQEEQQALGETSLIIQERREEIKARMAEIEHALHLAYNDNAVAKEKVQLFMSEFMSQAFTIVPATSYLDDKLRTTGNAVWVGYQKNNRASDLTRPDKHGVRELGMNYINSAYEGAYNPVYQWTFNYFDRIINSDIQELMKIQKEVSEALYKDEELAEGKLGEGLHILTEEQSKVELEILPRLQRKVIDNFMFEVMDIQARRALNMEDQNNNLLTIEQAREYVETLSGKEKTDMQESIMAYETQLQDDISTSKKPTYVKRSLFENAVMLAGNGGTGKTFMLGNIVLKFALLNNIKNVNVALVAPDGITEGEKGLTYSAEESIRSFFAEYNKGKADANKIKFKVTRTSTHQILGDSGSNTTSQILDNNHIMIFDEAGRFNEGDVRLVKSLYDKVNSKGAENNSSITPFLFAGDLQQIGSRKDAIDITLPIQRSVLSTTPLQYSHRFGNSQIVNLTSFFANEQVDYVINNKSVLNALPNVTFKVEGDKYTGAQFFANETDVIEHYLERAKVVGTDAALVFINQEQFDQYRAKYEKQFTRLHKEGKLKINVLYNNIKHEGKTADGNTVLKTIQGQEVQEVYLIVPLKQHASKSPGVGTISDIQYRSLMYTGVSRAKSYIAMVGDIAKNSKDQKNLKEIRPVSEKNMAESLKLKKESLNRNIGYDALSDKDYVPLVFNKVPTFEEDRDSEVAPQEVETKEVSFESQIEDFKKSLKPQDKRRLTAKVNKMIKDDSIPVKTREEAYRLLFEESGQELSLEGLKAVIELIQKPKPIEVINEITEEVETLPEVEDVLYVEQEDDGANGMIVMYLNENGKIVEGTQTGIYINNETLFMQINGSYYVPLIQKYKASEQVKIAQALEESRKENQTLINKERGNIPIQQGSVSKAEWNNLKRKTNMFFGSYLAGKGAIMTALTKTSSAQAVINPNSPTVKIIWKQGVVEYKSPVSRENERRGQADSLIGDTSITNPLQIWVNINNINLESIIEDTEIINAIRETSTDGWVQTGYMTGYSYQNIKPDWTVAQVENHVADHGGSRATGVNLHKFLQSAKNGRVLSHTQYQEMIHEEGYTSQHVRSRTEERSGAWVVPASYIGAVAHSVTTEEGNHKYVLVSQKRNARTNTTETVQFVADTLSLFEKIEGNTEALNNIKKALNDIIETDLTEEGAIEGITNNIVYKMSKIPHNIRTSKLYNLSKSSVKEKTADIQEFANLLLEAIEGNGDSSLLHNIYITAYNSDGDIDYTNLKVGGYPTVNTFFKLGNIRNIQEKPQTERRGKEKFMQEYQDDTTSISEQLDVVSAFLSEEDLQGIKFQEGLRSALGKIVHGMYFNGQITARLINNRIQRHVLQHEVFHKILDQGVTKETKQKILDDYRRRKIKKGELASDVNYSYETLEEYAAKDFQSLTPETFNQNWQDNSLFGRIGRFINRFIDRVLSFLNIERKVKTYEQFVQNIFDGKYKSNLMYDSTNEVKYMGENIDVTQERFDEGIYEIFDTSMGTAKELKILNEIYDGNQSEQNIHLRKIVDTIFSKTIFNNREDDGTDIMITGQSNHISLDDAIQEFKQEAIEAIKNRRVLPVLELEDASGNIYTKNSKDILFTEYMNYGVTKDFDALHTLLLSKIQGTLDPNDTKSLSERLDIVLKFAYPTNSKINATNIQYALDGTIDIQQMTSLKLKQIMDSIPVARFNIVAVRDKDGNITSKKLEFDKYLGGLRTVTNAWEVLRGTITRAVSSGDFMYSGDIATDIENLATYIIRPLAESKARVGSDDYGNSLAFQLMSVYDMLYDSPYSIFNKYQNTDNINEINALEDFWHTFMSHMQSTSQNKPAFVSLTKGINQKNLTEEGAFISYMLSKVRRKVLDTDSQYKSWIEKEYGSPLSNPSFRFINDVQANSMVLRVQGKNFATLKNLKNDVMIELNKTDGKIDFKLIDNMRQLMSSYGVTMSNEMIRILLENPEFYYESISETVRKSADVKNFLNYFAIGSFMSMNIGAKLQYAKAQIMAIDNKKSTTVDNETNYNYASEIISYFDRMVSNIYGNPDKTAEQISKDIAKVRQDVDALFKQAVKKDLLTNEQVNDIKALWAQIEDLAPYYGTILRKFRGFAFIKSDIEIRDVMADERDAALDQIKEQDKSYTPNPLQFDFALKGLHGIVSNYTTTGKTERIGNKTKQIYREATNADKVYLKYFNAPSAERQRQIQKLKTLVQEMHRQGRFPSMIFNPVLAGQGIKINDIIDISEMRNGSFKTAEIVPTDTVMTMLIAAADGTKNGSYRYIDSPRGDSGKVVAIEASSMLGTISPKQKFTSLDMDKKPSVATIEAIDNIKNIMRTYHMKHLQSATDFINVMNSIAPMLSGKEAIDVKILVDEMNMIIQKHKEPLEGKILGLDHMYDIPNYNFWKIYQNSAKVLNILNESGQVENVYNVLRNLGLVDGIDIVEGKDGKALGGRALHMNIKTKNADLKYDILDRTYNAVRIYRSGELETQAEGIRTAEEEAQIRESAYSSIEVNPKTNREAWEWISRLFYSDLAAMQNKIKSLSSQADFNMPDYVRDILTINYNENKEFIPFFEQKTIESNPEYAINWGMLNYFMMNHIVCKSVSHMINGHDVNYKDAADLTNRSKINYTNGKVATPSNKGMGQKFQAIILRDSVMKQAIEKYNMVTNQSLTVEEIIEATDGTTIDTAIGRHFYNKSMGGNMNAYTGKVKKTVYSFNDMLTDEYTTIKHAQDTIDPESVRKNNHEVFLEYIALATLDEQIANQFLDEMYTAFNNEEVTNIGYVFQEAIDKAIQAIQAKRETGELDINNMVLFFTHPSAVKKGAMYVNDASIIDNNEVDMAEEMSAQQFRTVSLNTEGLREVFDSNSQIENSRESVLATQAFAAIQSILDSDSATEADRLLAENMYNNLSNLGMKSNGDVKNDKAREKIMSEAIELMVTGQLQTKREGQTLRLSQMMINNRNIMHLPNITQLLVQTLNKMVNNETSKIRYKGSSYIQVSDATYRLYDATITYPDGTVMTQAVTDEGKRKLNRQSKTGLFTVEYSAPRKMKPMDHKEGNISRAEAIMGTTTQKMFGITGEHSIVDVIHILVDDKVININAIDEKGMYNGKQIFDSEGNLANAEGVILNKDTNKKFKNHLNTINQFKQSLNILMFRKPTSLLTSGGMYQVVEFEHTGNRVITSAKKNAWDDSDYDIDKLFSYEYEHENTESARLINSYYKMIEKAFTKLATDGNIRAGISTEGVNEVAGEMKLSEKGTPNTMWSNYDTNNRAYVGAKSISRWANTLVTANTIGRIAKMKLEDRRLIFNDNYKGRFGEAYDILNRMFNNPKEYEFYVSVAVMLQAAVDNTKEAKLGRLGISQYATNEIVAMLYDGKSLSEIKDFMMNPVVAKVYSNIENAESLSGNMNILTPFMLLATDRLNETAKQSYEYTMPEGFQKMIEETKADVSVNMADLTDEQVEDLMSNRDRAQINLDDSPMAIANKKAAGYRDLTSKYWQQRNKLAQKINDIRLDPKGLDEDILSLKSEMTELDEKYAREVGILNAYIKYQLQKYSVVGEVIKRMTFFMDIKDGVASKPHQFDNSISNIEREYGMPIEQIDFSPKGLKPITHDTGSLKRIMNYEFEHNDYYKKLDTDMQRAYEGLFGAVSSMVKLGNMIYLMPHMRLYATQHKFVNQLREQFTMFNPLLQQNLNKALHASYRGNNGNPTSYYARQNALTGVMLSVAFDRMIENRRVFGEKEQYGKAITLETYDINEIMTINEFNKAYESIDISDAKQGRQRFIKRLPTYMVNMGGLMDLYYNARMNNQNTSHYENIFRDVYLIDSTEIERMFVGMERAKGNHFMNFIEQVGSEHQSLMVIKNSKQLLENPHAYQEVRMMFENLPNRVQELFGVYEVILNQFETRSASLHDIISEKMYETLAEYLSDHTDLNMDISYNNAFYDNTVTTDKVLSTIMVTDIDSMIPKLRDAISKYGPTEDVNGTMVKYGIVKIGSKEKINNSNVVYKKIYLSELQEQVGEDGKAIPINFNDIGTVVFNNVLSNAIPYSNTESMVSPNRAMKNLSEKNIYEVLKGNRTLINLYSGHNFKETDISQGGTHYVYSTNAGVNVIIDSIADKHIIVKPVGQVVGLQDKVEAKNKTISYAKMEIRALSEAIQAETKRINETFEVYGIKDEQGNIIKTVYRTKDGKITAVRVSSLLGDPTTEFTDTEKDMFFSDGNLADAISKSVLKEAITRSLGRMDVITDMSIAAQKGTLEQHPLVKLALETFYNNYKLVRGESDNHVFSKYSKEEIVTLMTGYIRSIMNSNFEHLITMLKSNTETNVEVLTDVRLMRNYNGNLVMGEADILVLYHDSIRKKNRFVIIDTKTSNLSYVQDGQSEAIVKAFNQIAIYSQMMNSMYGLSESSFDKSDVKNAVWHIQKFSKFQENVNFVEEKGIKEIQNLPHNITNIRTMENYKRTIEEFKAGISEKVKAETDKNMELISKDGYAMIKIENNEATKVNCK